MGTTGGSHEVVTRTLNCKCTSCCTLKPTKHPNTMSTQTYMWASSILNRSLSELKEAVYRVDLGQANFQCI